MINCLDTNDGKSILFASSKDLSLSAFIEIDDAYPVYVTFSYLGGGGSICLSVEEWVEFKELINAIDKHMMKRLLKDTKDPVV
jgi:hypothetical protein